ncbi:MAG: hypothetical protein WBP12_00475 [Candidatus Saccharimonas sp.]
MANNTQPTLPGVIAAHWKRILLVVLGLGIVAAAVYYFGFVRLYKSDYAHTLQGVNRMTTAYNDLLTTRDAAISSLGKEDSVFGSVVEKYRKQHTSYLEADASLQDNRALRDSSVWVAYDALQKRNATFVTFVSGQLALLALTQGVAVNCTESAPSKLNTSDLNKIVEVYDAAFGACTNAMKSLAKSDDTAATKRASDNVAYFDTMRAHAVAMQAAYTAGSRSTFESEYNALLESLAQYKAHIQVRDLLDIKKDVVPSSELNALATVLSQRQK